MTCRCGHSEGQHARDEFDRVPCTVFDCDCMEYEAASEDDEIGLDDDLENEEELDFEDDDEEIDLDDCEADEDLLGYHDDGGD